MNGSAPQRALYFRLGAHTLAAGDEGLRQVVTVASLTRVPRVGPELLGLFSVGGEVLPLIDLRPLIGESPAGVQAAGGQAALLEHGGRRIALLLGEVHGFFPVREASAPASNPALAALTLTHTVYDDLTAGLLDLGRLMDALERQLVVV